MFGFVLQPMVALYSFGLVCLYKGLVMVVLGFSVRFDLWFLRNLGKKRELISAATYRIKYLLK